MGVGDWWSRGKEPILQNEAEIEVNDIADDAITTAKILDANVTQAKDAPNTRDGTIVANVADANVIGGIPVVFRITATTLTGDVDVVMTHKVRVIDVWCIQVGGAGGAADTIIAKNGGDAITDTISLNVSDNVVVRASTIDDNRNEIDAGADLTITGADAVTCEVYVLAMRVA